MRITIPAHVRVLDYLERRGVTLPTFCDGNGVCGRCRIRVAEGGLPVTPSDRAFLNGRQLGEGWRLACCAETLTPVVIETALPERSAPKPLHTQAADRAANQQHRYGLVLCGKTAALCDLTAVTVTGLCTGEDPVRELLARFPDAPGGLERCLCFGEAEIPALPCEVTRLPHPGTSETEAAETGILLLFAER